MRKIPTAVASLLALVLLLPLLLMPGSHPEAQGFSGGAYALPFTACSSNVSGNATGTQGYTVVGTSLTPVDQASTSAVGTNTHTYICDLTPPNRVQGANGLSITNVDFYYGVQTTGLGTQVAVLASGTMNAVTVFTKVTLPTPGAAETPSTVLPVRADTGTLLITPVVGSFNVATTTAGAFFSARFTPAAAIVMTDLAKYYLNVALLNTATSVTITNTPGVIVHTR